MSFLYVKAAHIIFIVTWFSGMFYLARLFVYNREANDKTLQEKEILQSQFNIMIYRLLYYITFPSAIITALLGLHLFMQYPTMPNWLGVKLIFVLFLYLYHISLHRIANKQKEGIFDYSSKQLRLWNEVPTIILVCVVFLVVGKNVQGAFFAVFVLFVIMALIMMTIRLVKKLKS